MAFFGGQKKTLETGKSSLTEGDNDRLLAFEILIDVSNAHLRSFGDSRHARAMETFRYEAHLCRVENLVLAQFGTFLAPGQSISIPNHISVTISEVG